MTDSLLNEDQNFTPNIDPDKNYLEELTSDGKKFDKSKYASEQEWLQALAKGKYVSDLYVDHLEKRLDEMREDYTKIREEYNAGPKLQELLDQLSKQQLTSRNNLGPNEDDHPPDKSNLSDSSFDFKEVESLVLSKIQEHENSKKQNENFDLVRNKLKERYGSDYQNVLKEQIESLGLTEDFVNDLAKKHPTVLYRTLGLDKDERRENFSSPPRSNVRSDSFLPQVQKRTWAYYQKMRKENPKLYHNPKTIVQMHEDARELGADFEDGDFHSI